MIVELVFHTLWAMIQHCSAKLTDMDLTSIISLVLILPILTKVMTFLLWFCSLKSKLLADNFLAAKSNESIQDCKTCSLLDICTIVTTVPSLKKTTIRLK